MTTLANLDPLTVILIVALMVGALSVGVVFTFAGSDIGTKYVTFLTPITVALIGILTAAQTQRNHIQNQQALTQIKENTNGEKK